MEPNSTLRLDRIDLTNFRCFADCTLELDPKLTILVAENAQGKTGLLDAISFALDVYVSTMLEGRVLGGFKLTDIRRTLSENNRLTRHLPVSFEASGVCCGSRINWRRSIDRLSSRVRTSTKHTDSFKSATLELRQRTRTSTISSDRSVILPAVAYYRIDRIKIDNKRLLSRSWSNRQELGRLVGYIDCISPSTSFYSFLKWFEKRWRLLQSSVSKYTEQDERPEVQLAAVRSAVDLVLQPTGWTQLTWEVPESVEEGYAEPGFLAATHAEHGRLPITMMSDGVRNMIAMVADLAYRCVRLNPHLGESATAETPGIVLIDEVDLHLHPRWQQLIVGQLQAAFPKMQFIFSTHSPHVLSAIDADTIRVLHLNDGHGEAKKPGFQTMGDESASVLAKVMDVDPIPDVGPARLMSHYRELVQNSQDQSAEARAAWRELTSHFGAEHHLIQEAAVLRRLQEFKRSNHI